MHTETVSNEAVHCPELLAAFNYFLAAGRLEQIAVSEVAIVRQRYAARFERQALRAGATEAEARAEVEKYLAEMELTVAGQRARFEAIYFDGCEETSMNASVHGAWHDAAHDEYLAWDALEVYDREHGTRLDSEGELLPC